MTEDLETRLIKMRLISVPSAVVLIHTPWAHLNIDHAICQFLRLHPCPENYRKAAAVAMTIWPDHDSYAGDYDLKAEATKLRSML